MSSKPQISDKASERLVAAPPRQRAMSVIEKSVKILLPVVISAVLMLWLFEKVNFRQIGEILRHDCDFFYIGLMMFFTMLSKIIRGIRWGIQLRAAGVPRMPVISECVSIFGAYALNLIVTYLGEAWRCIYVARREKVKLATVVGTDLGDRGTDGVCITVILVFTLFVARDAFVRFLHDYPLGRFIDRLADHWIVWTILGTVCILFCAVAYCYRNTKLFRGMSLSIQRMWDGFKVLFTMPAGKMAYVLLSIAIWICYFLMIYISFFAFPFTRELIYHPGYSFGLLPGLVAFVFGSVSMAVPSSGGLGPWNIAVIYALMLFGIGRADATAFTIMVLGFENIMIIALGLFSAVYIFLDRNKKKAT